MNVSILYENPHVLAVNKPAGLIVHGDGKTEVPTLAEWVRNYFPELEGVGEPWVLPDGRVIDRPGIVHRLDKETSGALLIAKDQETFLWLKHAFAERQVAKTYHAFVHGALKESRGVIDRPIGKSRSDFRRYSAQPGARGELRDAVTEFFVLKGNAEYSFVKVHPKTGRTHQIRVHFKAIHHPVVCDRLYAPRHVCGLGFNRLALHASALTFTLPSGDALTVEAPFPEDFEAAEKQL